MPPSFCLLLRKGSPSSWNPRVAHGYEATREAAMAAFA